MSCFKICKRNTFSGNSSENDRSVALVEWASGRKDRYRIGHNGKIDLKCVRPGRGMLYYRSHLRQCGQSRGSTTVFVYFFFAELKQISVCRWFSDCLFVNLFATVLCRFCEALLPFI